MFRNVFLIALIVSPGVSFAQYAVSHLRALHPPVVQQGQTSSVRITGSDLVAVDQLWFSTPEIARQSAEAYQVGSKRRLSICPIGAVATVWHALEAYLDSIGIHT